MGADDYPRDSDLNTVHEIKKKKKSLKSNAEIQKTSAVASIINYRKHILVLIISALPRGGIALTNAYRTGIDGQIVISL